MEIRTARESDRGAILDLYRELYGILKGYSLPFDLQQDALPAVLASMLRSKLWHIAVADDNGRVAGFVSAGISRMDRKLRHDGQVMVGLIGDICVAPELRGRGAAAGLLRSAEAWLSDNGVRLVECCVADGNKPSDAFFRKNGYRDLSRVLYKTL